MDWDARYREGTTPWERPGLNPAFEIWQRAGGFDRVDAVLVPGGGRSREVPALARAGHTVTVVDLAPAAVGALGGALAAEGLEAELLCTDLLAWEPDRPFDAVYEQTCLCALPPEHWAEYADRLFRWLRPGGRLFALFMQTGREGGPPFHCAISEMRKLFPASRWDWPDGEPLAVPHPAGIEEHGYVLTRR